MNITGSINFKQLREKGPSSIDVKNDEIIKLDSRGKSTKYIVDEKHYTELFINYATNKTLPSLSNSNMTNSISSTLNHIKNNNIKPKVFGCVGTSHFPDRLPSLLDNKDIYLEEEETLYYYDQPILFIASDKNNLFSRYLCNLVEEKDLHGKVTCEYHIFKIYPAELDSLKNGNIDLLSLIKSKNKHFLYSTIQEDKKLPKIIYSKISIKELESKGYLPDEDFFLKDNDERKSLKLLEKFIKDNNGDKEVLDAYKSLKKKIMEDNNECD